MGTHGADQCLEGAGSSGNYRGQPSLTIYSKSAFTAVCSTQFVEKLTNEHEDLAFDEFSHVDFYYKPEAEKASTDAVAEFFHK